MMRLILSIILTCACTQLQAQVNYVLNPDFEQYSKCPYDYDQIKFCNHWSAIDTVTTTSSDSFGNPNCTPEYCNVCATDNHISAPRSFDYYQYPHSGNGMAEVMMFTSECCPPYEYQRDYLQGRLYKKLAANRSYCVSFWVCMTESSQYAINHIGAYLDDGSIDSTEHCGLPQAQYTPQIYTPVVIADTMHWTKIEGSFTANGTERFITIGNFFSKNNTVHDSVLYYSFKGINPNSWYLVDDVSIIQSDTRADAGADRHITRGDSTFIGLNEVIPGCKWYQNGQLIDSGAGIWVRPNVTTNYVLEQTLCGLITRDTVQVQVWAVGVLGVNGGAQRYELYPNPSNGNIELHQWMEDNRPVNVLVRTSIGALIYQGALQFKANKASLNLEGLAEGIYYVWVEGNDHVLKLVVQ